MKFRGLVTALAAAAVFIVPTGRASADLGDGIAGGIVGGIVGGVIVNEAAKNRERQRQRTRSSTRTYRAPAVSSVSRAETRQVQTSLNYFGFDAGYPDGVAGRRTRTAISGYQAYMGYPVTGALTTFERDFLIGSYSRAQAGGAATAQMVAGLPDGTRGLLRRYRDDLAGSGATTTASRGAYGLPPEVANAVNEIARSSDPTAEQLLERHGFLQLADLNGDGRTDYLLDTSVTGSSFWCGAKNCSVSVFASVPGGYSRNDFLAYNATPAMFTCSRGNCSMTGETGADDGTTMAAAPAEPESDAATGGFALPNFTGGSSGVSLASHCNKVSLLTNANGGVTTAENMTDPDFALSEQFCLARSYSIALSDEMIGKISGFTPAQIQQQCEGLAPALKSHVAALSLKPRAEVVRDVSGFVLQSGMSPEQLGTTGRICLGVGYRTDNMEVAVGSALLLAALGDAVYEELLGHHLSQGIGASKRRSYAVDWYDTAITALEQGATPVFAPAQSERPTLLRKAAFGLEDDEQAGNAGGEGAVVMPVFSVNE